MSRALPATEEWTRPESRIWLGFRALSTKEWVELRAIRWVGMALGLILPAALLAGAEASERGWMPLGRITSYSTETLFLEVLPAFFVVLWGLMALLLTGQCFAGERAVGTESFLLERPVPRSRIWQAKSLVVLVSTALVVAVHAAIWFSLSRILTVGQPEMWSTALRTLGWGGLVVVAVCLAAGSAAGTLVRTPVQSLLVALLLVALPAVLSALLGGLFPFASVSRLPVGLFVPVLIPLSYVACSFVMACRGEPAGRGRWRRGLAVLTVGTVAVPLVFAIWAPLAMRAEAGRLERGAEVTPSPGAPVALSFGGAAYSGWLIDVERGRRLRFFGPPVLGADWSADGKRFVLFTAAGPMGRLGRSRADIYDAGGNLLTRIRTTSEFGYFQLFGRPGWTGRYLVVPVFLESGKSKILVASTETGEQRFIDLGLRGNQWRLLGPTEAGDLYVLQVRLSPDGGETIRLQRLDPDRAALDPEVLFEEDPATLRKDDEHGWTILYRQRLSPSGRYLDLGLDGLLVDLHTGLDVTVPGAYRSMWLRGDRLAWITPAFEGVSLNVATPGETPRVVRRWGNDRFVKLECSPERDRLLVKVYVRAAPGAPDAHRFFDLDGDVPVQPLLAELWIYDAGRDEWLDLAERLERMPRAEHSTEWAGSSHLALSGPGFLSVADLSDPGETIPVIGKSP